jgi:CRISPR-associated protein Csm1
MLSAIGGSPLDRSMSVQIFLQGKLLGIEDFVLAPAGEEAFGESLLAGRAHWVSLLSEVLPRALLTELGLSKILLGSSGGGGFLLVLPVESRAKAELFLEAAAGQIRAYSNGRLRLSWASTENLGEWELVRKRLAAEMSAKRGTAGAPADSAMEGQAESSYFSDYLATKLRDAQTVGWSPENPARILIGEGKHTWAIGLGIEAIPMARHTALDEDGTAAAPLETLAHRSGGRPAWGILRGDVDGFGARIAGMNTIEDHVKYSVLFKQLFAGELEVVCSLPEYWQKATIVYCGGDDFAVYGSWDALLSMAQEIQRVFHRFANEDLKDLEGPEGKTISMALALAPELDSPFSFVYEEAGRNLETAKSSGRDLLHLFDKTIEWKQLQQAGEIKDNLIRLVKEYDCPPAMLGELSGFYREKPPAHPNAKARPDRPWRYYRRLSLLLGPARERGLQRLRNTVLTDLIGKSPVQVKLRPAGRVAVHWARLLLEA